jgi:ribonuclease R
LARKNPAPFPSKEKLLAFIEERNGRVGLREIMRAFLLSSEQRAQLKQVVAELKNEGAIEQGRGRRFNQPGRLPNMTLVEISGVDQDGDLLARPVVWDRDDQPPVIYMAPERRGQAALAPGERVLARLERQEDGTYTGRTVKRIAATPETVLGIFGLEDGQGRIFPVDKRAKGELAVAGPDSLGAQPGELVQATILPARRLGLRQARVIERLGEGGSPRSISLIAIHEQDIPFEFSPAALREAEAATAAPLGERADLRPVPLVTIDGAYARDFDDAVFAEADDDPRNPGGWHLIVAIADVAWYVRPRGALDHDAYQRGNSVYFPDRVVPMLPEALSNGWCSLKPDEDRPCMVVHLWIDAHGQPRRHRFERALMRSAARLTYERIQAARDGKPDDQLGPLMERVVTPLYGAYEAFLEARKKRGVLELDLPERQVILDEKGQVRRIAIRPRYDSHKLIEEFMIAANVAAAETLERLSEPCMYRVHDSPSPDKLDALREVLEGLGVSIAKGQAVKPHVFNRVLAETRDTPYFHMVNEVILRSQAQAVYSPKNIGHYGLALRRYAHFTSPIRRYSDLLVHRALIRGLKAGGGALESDGSDYVDIGEHISSTERRAATAERDTVDRFTAAYLRERVGDEFAARVTGVTRFGLFVVLEETGGDALIPVSTLPGDFYIHDERRHELRGRRTKRVWKLGQKLTVQLVEANPVTGGMVAMVAEGGGGPLRAPARPAGVRRPAARRRALF